MFRLQLKLVGKELVDKEKTRNKDKGPQIKDFAPISSQGNKDLLPCISGTI